MHITVHIERLILEDLAVANHDHEALQTAVEVELSRLLTGQGLAPRLQAGGALAEMRGEPIQLVGQPSAAELGKQIAQTVYEEIGQQ